MHGACACVSKEFTLWKTSISTDCAEIKSNYRLNLRIYRERILIVVILKLLGEKIQKDLLQCIDVSNNS